MNDVQYNLAELSVENFKGSKMFKYKAKCGSSESRSKRLVLLTGENGSGKSSNLQAIATALLGDAASPMRTIREGQTEAGLLATLTGSDGSKIVLAHRWRKNRSGGTSHVLEATRVHDKVASPIAKPQSTLDALLDPLTLDPTILYREKNAEKRLSMILRAAQIDDMELSRVQDKIDIAERAKKSNAMTADALRLQVAALESANPTPPPSRTEIEDKIKAQLVERSAMIEQRNKRHAIEQRCTRHTQLLDIAQRDLQEAQAEIERLQIVIGLATDTIHNDEVSIGKLEVELKEVPSVTDEEVSSVDTRLGQLRAEADALTCSERQWAKLQAIRATMNEELAKRDSAAALVESMRNARRELISQGLTASGLSEVISIDEFNGVTVYGKPFEDASASERVKAGAKLAMATKPNVRVLLLDDADCLGPDAITEISEWAEQENFDVFMTGVWMRTESADTILIEDGEVVEEVTNGQ